MRSSSFERIHQTFKNPFEGDGYSEAWEIEAAKED
jgi:glutamine synthetase type III